MRQADDLSDDESRPIADRRIALAGWLEEWHQAVAGAGTADPVFVALLDAQRRFAIPPELLDQLVQGTAKDLDPAFHSGELAEYATFSDLYRYCYPGRLRGWPGVHPNFWLSRPEGGKASRRNRHCVSINQYSSRCARGCGTRAALSPSRRSRTVWRITRLHDRDIRWPAIDSQQRQVLVMLAERASHFYQSADALLPLISPDSRAAMWVLVTIYHRLLRHIERNNFDVFSSRIGVPTYEKLGILGCGLFKTVTQGVWA